MERVLMARVLMERVLMARVLMEEKNVTVLWHSERTTAVSLAAVGAL